METHFQYSDREFEDQFANTSLNPEIFSHEAHLRLAWIHITQYGLEKAITNITRQLKNYTSAVGAANKYNATVTVAAIHAVYHFMIRSGHTSFADFIAENYKLKTEFRSLIFTHYRTDIFKSDEAKRRFLEPELLPFD